MSSNRRSVDLESVHLDRSKLTIGKQLGHGGYGIVYEGTYDGRPCAVKALREIPRNPCDKQQVEMSVSRDICMPIRFDHPALLPLIGYVPAESGGEGDPRKGFLTVMPLLRSQNVAEMVQMEHDGTRMPAWWPTTKSKCIFGMAAGLQHMHSQNAIHRDFKLHNVLLKENGDPCIADFGLARCQGLNMSCQPATCFMTAPEMLEENVQYDAKVDVYAYGIALYQLFSDNLHKMDGDVQLHDDNYRVEIWQAVSAGRRFASDARIPDYIWGLIQRCWSHSPAERPSMSEVVKELRTHRSQYAVNGTDMEELERYENSLMSLIPEEEEDVPDAFGFISSVPFKRG